MKQLIIITASVLGLVGLAGCGASSSVAPSQNSALNSISDSKGKEKSGWMQNGLDSWLSEEWTPVVEKNPEIRQKYMEVEKTPKNASVVSTSQSNTTTTQVSVKKEELTKKEVKYVEKKNKFPTLQEYLDKADVYFEAQERDYENSNVEKMKSMPVIGK